MKKLICTFVLMIAVLGLCACSNEKKNNEAISGNMVTPMPTTTAAEEEETTPATNYTSVTASLIALDTDRQHIIIKDIYDGSNYLLTYNGGCDVKNVYDQVISIVQLDSGEIVDVVFDSEKKKAISIYENKEVFRTSKVTGFKADTLASKITYGSANYMYTDNLVVLSSGKVLDPTEVMSRDVVTVRGIGNKIYSVTVDKGHGYLTFTGADDFIGGMLEIGSSYLYTISKDMMIVVPEGEYTVTLTNGSLEASKMVYISKDMTVSMDFGEYRNPVNRTGTVDFQIIPENADLFIEGNKVDHNEPVLLEFGTYIINLVSDEYDTYTTRVTVSSTYQIEKFNLDQIYSDPSNVEVEATTASTTVATTSSTTATTTSTTAATTTTSTTSSTETTAATTTGSVKVTISEPAGASVYVDNVYVGTAPVTINKNAGEYVITFKRQGYSTKSYIVDVDSSDGEQTLSFPAMSEE